MKLIGIGGLPRSGKDTLAELLIEKGYFGVSLGDIVRNISRTRHADSSDPISVANMTETSNFLRQQKGADFALEEALKQFRKSGGEAKHKGLLVYSVRAPAEADFIIQNGGNLIWLETPDRIRYQRAMRHPREGEAEIPIEEFRRQENLQWRPQPGIPTANQMNIEYVKSKATMTIINDSDSVEKFKKAAESALKPVL